MIAVQTKWPTRRLADCGEWVSGGTPSKANASFWNGNIPWISAKSLKSFDLNDSEDRITQAAVENGTALVPKGTVMFVVRGMSLANEFRVGVTTRPVAFNQDLRAIVPAKDIDGRFLTHFLKANQQSIIGLANNASHGTKRLPTELVEAVMVPVPPLPEQHRIVAILDKAAAISRKRKEGIRQTEELLRSTFLEMFGDPATNPKGWRAAKVGEALSSNRPGMRCGPFGTALRKDEYVSDGIPVWGIENVKPNLFDPDGSLFITNEKYQELTGYIVHPGDVLISRAGTVGRMCVARPHQKQSIIGTNLIRVALDPLVLSPDYFTALFTYFADRVAGLRASSDDGAYSFMQTGVLKEVRVPFPPIDRQNAFAKFIEKVRENQANRQRATEESDNLFAALVQRAFRGEL